MQNIIFIHINYILITYFSFNPIWMILLLTIIIHILASQFNTCTYNVIRSYCKFWYPRKLFCHNTNYLNLLALNRIRWVFNLYVGLQGFWFFYYLTILIFNLNDNKEWEFFERRNFISEITWMLINWNPYAHCICFY